MARRPAVETAASARRARARARAEEAEAARRAARELIRLSAALQKLAKASQAESRFCTGHTARFLATESQLSLSEAESTAQLAGAFERQARRASDQAVALRAKPPLRRS